MAAAEPFVFGSFTLYEGRSSYNLNQVNVTHHFMELAAMQRGFIMGIIFWSWQIISGRKEQTKEK